MSYRQQTPSGSSTRPCRPSAARGAERFAMFTGADVIEAVRRAVSVWAGYSSGSQAISCSNTCWSPSM